MWNSGQSKGILEETKHELTSLFCFIFSLQCFQRHLSKFSLFWNPIGFVIPTFFFLFLCIVHLLFQRGPKFKGVLVLFECSLCSMVNYWICQSVVHRAIICSTNLCLPAMALMTWHVVHGMIDQCSLQLAANTVTTESKLQTQLVAAAASMAAEQDNNGTLTSCQLVLVQCSINCARYQKLFCFSGSFSLYLCFSLGERKK